MATIQQLTYAAPAATLDLLDRAPFTKILCVQLKVVKNNTTTCGSTIHDKHQIQLTNELLFEPCETPQQR
jgi:hypothetical protein